MTKTCSHGIALFDPKARCIDCNIYWERMCIGDALNSLDRHTRRLEALLLEKLEKDREDQDRQGE